jgi:hypothetical protein
MKIFEIIKTQFENRNLLFWIMCGLLVATVAALVILNGYILAMTNGCYNAIDILFM